MCGAMASVKDERNMDLTGSSSPCVHYLMQNASEYDEFIFQISIRRKLNTIFGDTTTGSTIIVFLLVWN